MNKLLCDSGDANDVIAKIGKETVNRVSLQTLKPESWLNDEMENSQMSMLNLKHLHSLDYHCLTSYFM